MKRRAAPNQQAAGVSLFPFLAVLLCTMGALIVVLVVIARHAHMQVAEEARRKAAASADSELAAKRGELEWRISELTNSRDGTQKLLTEKQLELSHLEEHARRLKEQLEESAAAREHFSELAAGDARENDELKKRLSRLRFEAERTKTEIDKLRSKTGGGSGDSYAIIPYHGPNETHRRPIYIECRKDVVLLQPEGVALTEQDFTVDLGPSNPLVAALRAAREYHLRNQFAGKGEAGTPYPLFIIRPDGIMMWYAARAAISSWGSEFGYELVGQDWAFEFPPPDPMLTLAMRQAVKDGRISQAYLARAAPRLSHSGSHATFRAAPHGGLIQVEGSPIGGSGGRHGQGRPRGLLGRRGGLGGGPGGRGSSPGLLGSTEQGDGGGPIHSVDGGDNPYLSAQTSMARSGSGGGQETGAGDGSLGGRYPPSGGGYPAGGGRYPAGGNAANRGSGSWAGVLGLDGRTDGRYSPNGAGGGRYPAGGNGSATPAGNALAMAPGGAGQNNSSGGLPNGPNLGSGRSPKNGKGGDGTRAENQASDGNKPGSGNQPGTGNQASTGNRLVDGQQRGGALGSGSTIQPTATSGGLTGQAGADQVGNGAAQGAAAGRSPSRAQVGAGQRSVPGATGSGTSELAASSSTGTPSGGGPNVAASPNGIADATVVDNGDTASQAAGGSSRTGSPGGQSDSGSRAGSNSNAAQSTRIEASGTDGGSSSSYSRGRPGNQQTAGGSSGSSASSTSSSSGQTSSPLGGSSSTMQSSQPGMPMPSFNFGQQNAQPLPQSVAKQRGERNWANPDASTTNVPIERAIRVICDADHLTLLPEGRGRQAMRVIQLKPRTADSVDDLVTSVWDRIDSWGTAGRGMYWRPTLIMEVEPGGQRRYAELQSLLADSGFDVHGKPRTTIFGEPRRMGIARPPSVGRQRK